MSHLLQLLLLLILILVAAKGAGSLSTRLGQPAVLGEILVGLLLGPTVLDLLGRGLFQGGRAGDPLHPDLADVVHDLAQIGVILLMFVAGMETDLREMKRVGKVAFWAAAGGVVLPFGFGILTGRLFGYPWVESVFIGTVLTATSVSISAQTLMELGAMKSREGATILGAAVIDDVMGIIILSLVIAFTGAGTASTEAAAVGTREILFICGRMALFFLAAWLAGSRFLERATERVRRLPTSQPLMAFVLLVCFSYAFAAEYFGRVAAITGSYMAGLLFAQTRFKEEIDRGIHPITYSLFVPVFFVDIGLQADGRAILGSWRGALFALVVVLVAILAKMIGSGALAYFSGFNVSESLRVGVGMISRGEVGLIVAGYGLASGVIERDVFSTMVVMVLATTLVTPVLLRRVFPRGKPPAEGQVVFESVSNVEVR
ncbi:MAG TPA: cation:proton antiporter [Candidatus Polarisedimenticolia bacterium]|nr:cation:proton antiporter [Candidatus Polarisedimenticolia bacterium]